MESLLSLSVDKVDSQLSFLAVETGKNVFGLLEYENYICVNALNEMIEPIKIDLTLPVAFHYLADINALCIGFRMGDIVVVHLDNRKVEPVGIIDAGIVAMEWSPDTELVIVITSLGTVLEMTRDFYTVTEFPVDDEDVGACKSSINKASFVSVGWGKKETQFHGRIGKEAAKEVQSQLRISENDDRMPRVTWRGDGEYFVISYASTVLNRRVLRVFNREGNLLHVSEPVNQLEHCLSWKLSGNLITSTQMLPHKHDVVFFEKNGLRHGEFSLKEKDSIVKSLSWNSNSSLLAMLVMFKEEYVIQLWGSSNYHYYLKQELRLPGNDHFSSFQWDPESPLMLHALSESGNYIRYDFESIVLIGTSLSPKNMGTVAVIDGCELHLTPFKTRNVPPPMSFSKVDFDCSLIHISFGFDSDSNDGAVLLSNQSVLFLENISGSTTFIRKSCTFQLPDTGIQIRQIAWVSKDKLIGLGYNFIDLKDQLIEYELLPDSINFQVIPLGEIEKNIFCLIHNVNCNVLAFETVDGVVYNSKKIVNLVTKSEEKWILELKAVFPSPCPKVSCARIGTINPEIGWIGLNRRNKLYFGESTLALDCTSFAIHNECLIITTLEHVAKFLSLSLEVTEFKFDDNPNLKIGFNEKIRNVEQGAKIVIAVPEHINLVLQMPRGNLETICPRALVLTSVRKSIDAKDYLKAFSSCRKHRIDLNILIDHNPEQFGRMIDSIVSQIQSPEYLNLLIAGLKNEDVTITMYPQSDRKNSVGNGKINEKVNSFCRIIRNALEKFDNPRYNQSILTTLAKQEPPALEAALRKILHIKKGSADEAESALKYLIFLVEVDKLFDVSLGIYDFSLVLMVAQHSQKDPREYLPFLSELQKLDFNYQRFSIDNHLKKYISALDHLSKCGPERFEEVILYAKKHKLFRRLLHLYPEGSLEYKRALLEFAEFEFEKREFNQAAIRKDIFKLVYQMAHSYELAIDCYVRSLLWKEAISLIVETGMEKEPYVTRLIDGLIVIRRYYEAGILYLEFLNKPSSAVEMFSNGHHWQDALSTCHKFQLVPLIKKIIVPSLLAHSHSFVEDMSEMRNKLEKQVVKLGAFRELKSNQLGTYCFEPESIPNIEHMNDVDLFSDTASMATTRITDATSRTGFTGLSGISSRTGKTAKQRRKMARKRAAGKDKAFEDEYIMKSWKNSVERINALMPDIEKLLAVLLSMHQIRLAEKVQLGFKAVVDVIKQNNKEVYRLPVMGQLGTMWKEDGNVEESPQPHIIEPPTLSTYKWWSDIIDYE